MDNNPTQPEVPQTPVQPDASAAPKVLTNADILASQGLVEIVNADGSRSQVTKEVAQAMVDNLENLKKQLGGAE